MRNYLRLCFAAVSNLRIQYNTEGWVIRQPAVRASCSTYFGNRLQVPRSDKPSASACRNPNGRSDHGLSVYMLVEPKGTDAFKELISENESSKLRSTLDKMGRTNAKLVSTSLIPAAALLGFIATPGGRVVSAVGATVAGIASTIAKRKLDNESKAGAPAAISRLFETNGLTGVRPTDVSAVLDQFNLSDEESSELLVDIFRRFIVAMCKNSVTNTSDIRDLRDLRHALNLNGEQVGDAVYAASSAVYKERVLFTPSEELADVDNPNRKAIDKFIFLADRLFESSDTEEAYVYEMGRIRKVFGLDAKETKARALAIAKPFYRKALENASARLEKLRPNALLLAEKTLGIARYLRDEMHLEAFSGEAQSLIEDGKFKEGAVERLAKLGEALSLDAEQQRREVEAITVPIFEQAIARELEQALEVQISNADAARRQSALRNGRLAAVQLGLNIEQETAERVKAASLSNAANSNFIAAAKFARVGNTAKALEAAKELIAFVKASQVLLSKNLGPDGKPEGETSLSFAGRLIDASSAKEGAQLYRTYLKSLLSERSTALTDEEVQDLSILAALMGQGSVNVKKVYEDELGPMLRSTLEKAVADGAYSDAGKAEYKKLVAGMLVPAEIVEAESEKLYAERLGSYAREGSILTADEREDLVILQKFLDVKQEAVDRMHRSMCAATYEQSVLESMASTGGVVNEELRSALNVLRERLRLTEKDASELFNNAARIRMKPVINQIVSEFERTYMKGGKRGQKVDEGDDILVGGPDAGELGISSTSAVNSDILGLVDFYVDNGLAVEESDGTRSYPVNAEGFGSPQLFERLYQQFVVSAFTAEGKLAQRYVAAQPTFAGILALPKEKIDSIHADIGTTVVNQFFKTQLSRGTSIGPRETALLASVGSKLGLSPTEFDSIVSAAKKKILRFKIDTAFQKSRLTASIVRNIRETASGVGIDLKSDMRIEPEKLKRLFAVEAKELLDGEGELDELVDIAEAFGFAEEEAQAVLSDVVRERAKAALSDAVSAENQGSDAVVVANMSKLLAYLKLAGAADLTTRADRSTLERVYQTYMASRPSSTVEEEAELESDAELLRESLGLDGDRP